MIVTEWIMGTIGFAALFGQAPIKITPRQVKQALLCGNYIKTRATAWANSSRPAKIPSFGITAKDYDSVINLVTSEKAAPNLSTVPDDLSLDVLVQFLEVQAYLVSISPAIKVSQGLFGREIEPSTTDKSRFCWSCNTINDIRIIFDLLDAGALTNVEAEAFKTLFPNIAMEVAVQYLTTTIDYIYTNEKPTMASWQLQGISALLGVPMADFNDVMQWQGGYEQQGPGRPPSSKAPDFAKDSMSDMQSLSMQQ